MFKFAITCLIVVLALGFESNISNFNFPVINSIESGYFHETSELDIFVFSEGYLIYNAVSQTWQEFDIPNCVGNLTNSLFCLQEGSADSNLTNIDPLTGEVISSFLIESPSLDFIFPSGNSIIVGSNQTFDFFVYNTESNNLTCNGTSLFGYQSISYSNGNVTLLTCGPVSCTITTWNCALGNSTAIQPATPATNMQIFPQMFEFSNGNLTVPVIFTYFFKVGGSNYLLIANSSNLVAGTSIGNYTSLFQTSPTNIIALSPGAGLFEYTFNFTSMAFVLVNSNNAYSFSTSMLTSVGTQNALLVSTTGINLVMFNFTSFTQSNFLSLPFGFQTTQNTTLFLSANSVTGNTNVFSMTNNGSISLLFDFVTVGLFGPPTEFYGINCNIVSQNCLLTTINLTSGASQNTTIPNCPVPLSPSTLLTVATNGNVTWITLFNSSQNAISVCNSQNGSVQNLPLLGLPTTYNIFINFTANQLVYIQVNQYVVYNMSTWTSTSNISVVIQFSAFAQLTNDLALGLISLPNGGSNAVVFNPFTTAFLQTFTFNTLTFELNLQEIQYIQAIFSSNPSQPVVAIEIAVSSIIQNFVSVFYTSPNANFSAINTTNFGGSSNDFSICGPLGSTLLSTNCTNAQFLFNVNPNPGPGPNPNPNPNPSGSGISTGLIVAIVVVVLVTIGGCLYFSRHRVKKFFNSNYAGEDRKYSQLENKYKP